MLRLALVKTVPAKGDLEANCARLSAVLDAIVPHAPDVVITPEGFLEGYVATEPEVTADNLARFAVDPADSPYLHAVSAWSAQRRSWLIFCCARLSGGGVANSAVILNRDGALAGVYDKVHCQTHDRKYVAGTALPVFPSDFGPFGVMICADRRWPETVRTLALKGARIIFNPSWGMHDERNLHMVQTRSYESEVFIAFVHPQQALVCGPRGEIVLNETHDDSLFSVIDIDLSEVDGVRSGASAHLRDRRPDVYNVGQAGEGHAE